MWQVFLYMERNLVKLLLFLPAFRFASRSLQSGLGGAACNNIIGWMFKHE